MIKMIEQTTAWIIVILGSLSMLPGSIRPTESSSREPLAGFAARKLSAAQYRTLRSQLAAFCCHLLTEAGVNPRGSMVHLGNTNMPINRFFGTGVELCDHNGIVWRPFDCLAMQKPRISTGE